MAAFTITVWTLGGLQTYDAANFTERQRAAILHVCANAGLVPVEPVAKPAHLPILLASEENPQGGGFIRQQDKIKRADDAAKARLSGYTGDMCPNCGSTKMRRNGSCLLCEGCGNTTGCS